jgi:hypothetical protein
MFGIGINSLITTLDDKKQGGGATNPESHCDNSLNPSRIDGDSNLHQDKGYTNIFALHDYLVSNFSFEVLGGRSDQQNSKLKGACSHNLEGRI